MKLLAVDDDPIILELLTQFMQSFEEHDLTTTSSGAEALKLLQSSEQSNFDCILVDIQMPQMDGIELTKRIRAIERYLATPVLMLTGMSDKRYVDSAFAAGATDYVTKPFEVSELKGRLGLIKEIVSARQTRTKKIFATQKIIQSGQTARPAAELQLHEPISIYDVDNVIDYTAMENYVAQLSRGAIFGSTTFAFTIRKIEEFYEGLSSFEFLSLISDVAELISDTLAGKQFLMCYAGSGTFVCVTESGWRPKVNELMDAINLSLAKTELYDNSGQRLQARVSVGDAVRLIWKSGGSSFEAIADALSSAEAACAAYERGMKDLWMVGQRA